MCLAFAPLGVIACASVVGLDSLQDACEGDTELCCNPETEKRCGDQCVSLRDPRTGCGNETCDACPATHATANCDSANRCAIAACFLGFDDCNHFVTDGCEKRTDDDMNNCGICGNTCEFPGGEGDCTGGLCELTRCKDGWLNCARGGGMSVSQGDRVYSTGEDCETPIDTDNCGECDLRCASGEDCVATGSQDGQLVYECR